MCRFFSIIARCFHNQLLFRDVRGVEEQFGGISDVDECYCRDVKVGECVLAYVCDYLSYFFD